MNTVTFEDVLHQVNQLPLADRRKLRDILLESSDTIAAQKLDQRVAPLIPNYDGGREMQWLTEHGREYAGKWVALKDGELIAVCESATEAYASADSAGVSLPLVTFVEDPAAPPFVGV